MQKTKKLRCFLVDECAVSEEFTALPALSIVMIGFTLFIVLLTRTYSAYENRINQLQNYQIADSIAHTLTSPDCFFIKEGGLVDIAALQSDTGSLQKICEQYEKSGITFVLRLHWSTITQDFPENISFSLKNRVAVSKCIGLFLNDAQTIPGSLTIIVWRKSV